MRAAYAMTREQLDGLLEEIRQQQRDQSDMEAQLMESEARAPGRWPLSLRRLCPFPVCCSSGGVFGGALSAAACGGCAPVAWPLAAQNANDSLLKIV